MKNRGQPADPDRRKERNALSFDGRLALVTGAGRDLAERAASAGGPVDVLVANAGSGVQRAWQDADDGSRRALSAAYQRSWAISS